MISNVSPIMTVCCSQTFPVRVRRSTPNATTASAAALSTGGQGPAETSCASPKRVPPLWL